MISKKRKFALARKINETSVPKGAIPPPFVEPSEDEYRPEDRPDRSVGAMCDRAVDLFIARPLSWLAEKLE